MVKDKRQTRGSRGRSHRALIQIDPNWSVLIGKPWETMGNHGKPWETMGNHCFLDVFWVPFFVANKTFGSHVAPEIP